MSEKVYRVKLGQEQRQELEQLLSKGKLKVRKYRRAQVLLLADENHVSGGKSDKAIGEQVGLSLATVGRVRHRFAEAGLAAALEERARPGRPSVLDGKVKAKVTALACSKPPDGYAKWSLRLLADKAVEFAFVDDISHETVRDILKKTSSSPI